MNPKNGVLDFEGINNLQPFFDAAKRAGLWIIARPGPYIKSDFSYPSDSCIWNTLNSSENIWRRRSWLGNNNSGWSFVEHL